MTFEQLEGRVGQTLEKKDWHQHKNGGAWIHKNAFIADDPSIYIGEKAVVWSGTIWGGEIWGGEIRGGEIWGGEIRGGEIRGGEIWGGEIRGGVIWGGEIRGGVIWGGEIRGGEIWGGEIRGGVIWGGEIRGGEIWGGEIRGGEIRGGEIWGGEIQDGKWERQPIFIQGSRHPVSNAKPGYIQIGCKCEPFKWWKSKDAERFASDNCYSKEDMAEYEAYIDLVIKFGK